MNRVAFSPAAQQLGVGRVGIRLLGPCALPPDFFEPCYWHLDHYDANGIWREVDGLDGVTAAWALPNAESAMEIIVSCGDLSGPTRLRGTHSALDSHAACAYALGTEHRYSPFYVELEGLNLNGSARIPSWYWDEDASMRALSQRIEDDDSIATAGNFTLTLVDLDHALSRAFAPRSAAHARTRLAAALEAEDESVVVAEANALDVTGFVWVGREAIRYEAVTENGHLVGVERGALGTRGEAHAAGSAVFGANPFLAGRWLTVRQALDASRQGDDPVLFRGLVERCTPAPDNLLKMVVSANDSQTILNRRIGSRLPQAALYEALSITGENRKAGRFGNDRLYVRAQNAGESEWRLIEVKLSNGIYLREYESEGHPLHIGSVIGAAFERAAPGLLTKIAMTSEDLLTLDFRVDGALEIIPAQTAYARAFDDALTTLGFDDESSGVWRAEQNDGVAVPTFATYTAKRQPAYGLAMYATGALLDPTSLTAQKEEELARHHVFALEDELVWAERVVGSGEEVTTTLAIALGAEALSLVPQDAARFPASGGYVRCGSEIMAYARKASDGALLELVRGAFNTEPTAHAAGSTLALMQWPRLEGLERGLYQTEVSAHAGLSMIKSVGCSDTFARSENGELIVTRAKPAEFLLDLLNGRRETSVFGLYGPPDLIDEESVYAAFADADLSYNGSFRRLVLSDETYRDVLVDLLKSLGRKLVIDARGRLTVQADHPPLEHELGAGSLSDADFCSPPSVSWMEGTGALDMQIDLDYEPASESYATRVDVSRADERGENASGTVAESLYLASQCLQSAKGGGVRGAAAAWARDLAATKLLKASRFRLGLTLEVPLSATHGLRLLAPRRISSAPVPNGEGGRGLTERVFEVCEIERLPFEARARLSLAECPRARYGGFAPAATIIGYVTATHSLLLRRDALWAASARPSEFWRFGDPLLITRSLGADYLQSEVVSLVDVAEENWFTEGVATLTLSTAPSFTPIAGDILCGASYTHSVPDTSLAHRFVSFADAASRLGTGTAEAFVYTY